MSKKSVLFVDDEPSLLRAYARLFRRDFEVILADGPEVAIRCLEQRADVSLILCDLFMPTMSGVELFELVRERFPGLEARFAFITGGVARAHVVDTLASLPNPVLNTPVDPGEIRDLAAAA